MAGKIKGIYKGFKCISQIFVVKEREMEIGHPTDVKHVAHIGLDHSSAVAPSWMNEFKTSPDRTAKSTGIDQSMGSHPTSEMTRNRSCTDLSDAIKKRKRRKKNTSIVESSSTKSSRFSKTNATFP